MTAVRVLKFGDWPEFSRDVFVELFGDGIFRHGRYLFRGSADADWTLQSYFDRRFATVPMERRMLLWERLITEWRHGCEEAGVEAAVLAEDRTLWALGQHHGLPTRLLDWSTSPYVAAFFAFAGHLTRTPDRYAQVAIWVLHLDNPVWLRDGGVEVVSVPAVHNARLRAQGGRFTLCRASIATLEEYVDRFATGVALTKCVLPASAAARALPDLDAMGVTSAGLFSDLGGTATLATMRAVLQSDLA
ncbi:MAG TPA: FRG domain-containing protein [Mycobacteriales bacterium]